FFRAMRRRDSPLPMNDSGNAYLAITSLFEEKDRGKITGSDRITVRRHIMANDYRLAAETHKTGN
ncbi:MAG: hypothetical protein NZ837_02420, partial [Gammaproteobacteria bacterium]|nr:hypothetical protein [Gammaproteobacteria bacterium]